jgi:hypothetical protein
LGCREPLEQLIFSCLQEEVTGRYALGWTGSGLGLAASLSWFSQRYHWTRRLDGATVALDRTFRAGVFDFADRLVTNPDGTWAKDETVADGRTAHVYEIHTRHYERFRADRTAKIAGRPHHITLLRLHGEAELETDGPIVHIPVDRYVSTLRAALKEGVAIVGGTPGALLRGQEKLRTSKTTAHTTVAALAVDESSMMLTPHFVALATLLADGGRILLAGDHRQLDVILTHDWDAEDRPNIVEYQPQASAYTTVQALTERPAVTPATAAVKLVSTVARATTRVTPGETVPGPRSNASSSGATPCLQAAHQ